MPVKACRKRRLSFRDPCGRFPGTTRSWAEESCLCRRSALALLLLWTTTSVADPPAASRSVTSRPSANLVANGTFEQGNAGGLLPANWTTKHPDNVKRVNVGAPRGWAVEMTGDKELMGTYGTDLLGSKIPVKANMRYRCTGYTKSAGPRMIVFIKGYATVTHRVKGKEQTGEDAVYQMRKEIKPSADWEPFNLDFQIKPTSEFSPFQHPIEYLRITLWAYWPEGTCWYDNIRFEEVGPVPADQQLRADAVTHVGVKPRLAETQLAQTQPAFDEEQAWMDAGNAWAAQDFEEALKLAEQLVLHAPDRGDYHLMAARAAAKLQRWPDANRHTQWLLAESPGASATAPARKVEAWQRDWASLVHAEVLLHTGPPEEARRILKSIRDTAASPNARAAAEEMLKGN